ncbi:Oxidoreductase family NAD-binding rossmann fold protein [Quillaja saponaria]|uniref:Oxidoreductase family NAD-binding rossmann fold protein n=1 Tax=Quillaja saponaria TaxID=32244 RepID=A0AAD7M6D4_QUISA|nr:Oxidoreductase family NAD-binding rossmann fold protein [Quillaja saponaria]
MYSGQSWLPRRSICFWRNKRLLMWLSTFPFPQASMYIGQSWLPRRRSICFLEKPTALDLAELDQILEACESKGVQFMDGKHPRTWMLLVHLETWLGTALESTK